MEVSKKAAQPPHRIITQHNHLINAYFDIPTVHLRAFLYALSHIHKDDTELPEWVKIPINVLHSSVGGRNYRHTKKLATELRKISFDVESKVTDNKGKVKKRVRGMNIFISTDYTEDGKNLNVKIHPDLKPYLIQLKGNYTPAELEQLLNLKTVQAYRIYMFIKQQVYKQELYNLPPDPISYKDLRLMLGMDVELDDDDIKKMGRSGDDNIEVVKYPKYAEFRRRVLESAQKELEDTDMAFNFEPIKKGRNVDSILFTRIKTIPINEVKTGGQQRLDFSKPSNQPYLPNGTAKYTTPKPKQKEEVPVKPVQDDKELTYEFLESMGVAAEQIKHYMQEIEWKKIREICMDVNLRALKGKIDKAEVVTKKLDEIKKGV